MQGMNMGSMKGVSGMGSNLTNTTTIGIGSTTMGIDMATNSIGVMGTTFNFNTSGFSILFVNWEITTNGQFIGSMLLLFVISFLTDLLGRYKITHKKLNEYSTYTSAFKVTLRAFLGALLMLTMMTFNFYVILFIVLGTGAAHLFVPMKQQDQEAFLCH